MANFKKMESKNKYSGKVECPGCNSLNTVVSSFSINSLGIAGLCFIAGCIAIWIPVLGWIAAPILFAATLFCLILSVLGLINKTYTFRCSDCSSKYKISKKEYNELIKKS